MRLSRSQRAANWLAETRRGRVVMWFVEWTSLAAGALLAGWMLYSIEHHFFPVIKNWKLEEVQREGDYWIVRGIMLKDRPCELVQTSVMAIPKMPLAPRVLIYQIKPTDILGGNSPTGLITWGPWEMKIPKTLEQRRNEISSLEVVGHHRCHMLWNQETSYGFVRMESLP